NAELCGHLLTLLARHTDERDDLGVVDVGQALEVLDAERARTGQCYSNRHVHLLLSLGFSLTWSSPAARYLIAQPHVVLGEARLGGLRMAQIVELRLLQLV